MYMMSKLAYILKFILISLCTLVILGSYSLASTVSMIDISDIVQLEEVENKLKSRIKSQANKALLEQSIRTNVQSLIQHLNNWTEVNTNRLATDIRF